MYGVMFKWTPPSGKEPELIKDFKEVADFAKGAGALSTNVYKDAETGEYIGIQMWPSQEFYYSWFNETNFEFRSSQPARYVELVKKIKDVYKCTYLRELQQIF